MFSPEQGLFLTIDIGILQNRLKWQTFRELAPEYFKVDKRNPLPKRKLSTQHSILLTPIYSQFCYETRIHFIAKVAT